MQPGTKRLFFICGVIVLILLILNYFKRDPGIQQIMQKLDSTKVLLDSAQQKITASQTLITRLQADVDSYSQQVKESDYNVAALEASRSYREKEFLHKISKSQQGYEVFRQQLQQSSRSNWPVITIDTSHFQFPDAN